MPTEVRMPKLGMAMKKGTVKRWLVAEGGTVEQGKPLLEIITEKINAVVEAPGTGVLGRVLAADNTELPVGALLGLIAAPGESLGDAEQAVAAAPAPAAAAPAPAGASAPAPAAGRAGGGRGGSG